MWSVGEKVPSIPRIQQFIEAAWTSGKGKLLVNAFKSSKAQGLFRKQVFSRKHWKIPHAIVFVKYTVVLCILKY